MAHFLTILRHASLVLSGRGEAAGTRELSSPFSVLLPCCFCRQPPLLARPTCTTCPSLLSTSLSILVILNPASKGNFPKNSVPLERKLPTEAGQICGHWRILRRPLSHHFQPRRVPFRLETSDWRRPLYGCRAASQSKNFLNVLPQSRTSAPTLTFRRLHPRSAWNM